MTDLWLAIYALKKSTAYSNVLMLRHEGKEQGACALWVAGCTCSEVESG